MEAPTVESIRPPQVEPAPRLKLQRKVRKVARVTLCRRHRNDCKRREETNNARRCPRWARYFRAGRLTRISLDTCDRKAAEITLSLKAASEGKPGVVGQPLPKKPRAGSRQATSSPLSLEFPPSTWLLVVPEAFGRCKAISFVSTQEGQNR
jgi:hypothetical protein